MLNSWCNISPWFQPEMSGLGKIKHDALHCHIYCSCWRLYNTIYISFVVVLINDWLTDSQNWLMIKLASRSRGQNSRSQKYNRFFVTWACFAVIFFSFDSAKFSNFIRLWMFFLCFCLLLFWAASDSTLMITILIFLFVSFTTCTAHTTHLLIRNENLNVKFHEITFPVPCDKYHAKTFGQRNVSTQKKTYTTAHGRPQACST